MDQEARENITMVHNGKTYRLVDLSEEGQFAFLHVQDLQNKIQEKQFELQQLDMSRVGFMKILEPAVQALSEAQEAAQAPNTETTEETAPYNEVSPETSQTEASEPIVETTTESVTEEQVLPAI